MREIGFGRDGPMIRNRSQSQNGKQEVMSRRQGKDKTGTTVKMIQIRTFQVLPSGAKGQ